MILLNLGSNIKPRHRHLQMAVEALRCEIPGEYTISDIYESAPWGYESEAPYLNIGVLIHPDDTSLTPLQLLERTERAQAAVDTAPHRDRDGGYIDRRIDIDIIAIDSIVLSTPRLTLPHPRMHLREFVLVPLAQLAPGWVHPVTGLNASAMLARLT